MQRLYEIPGLNVYLQVAVTIISVSLHYFLTRKREKKESLLMLITVYTIGLSGWFGIMSGLFGHIIFADQVASGIGWPVNSGFQMELGFFSIGLGIVGYAGFWRRDFWLPFIICKSIFLWGAGFTHILHAIRFDNFSDGNIGIIVYWDFILPIILIALFVVSRKIPFRE